MLSLTLTTTNGTSLWSITNINRNFSIGFLYGAYYALTKLGEQNNFTFIEMPDHEEWNIGDTAIAIKTPKTFEGAVNEYNALTEQAKQTFTAIIVRSPVINYGTYVLYIEGSVESYLQGLFTALTGFNIPITNVLLVHPFKNGRSLVVEGLDLPKLF